MVAIAPLNLATAMSKPANPTAMTAISLANAVSKPRKSILKTPTDSTLGYKRKKVDIDMDVSSSDASSTSPSPKKRVMVTFKIDTQQQSDDVDGDFEKSTAVVHEEVRRAIQRHLVGDSDAYDRVKEVFAANPKELEDDGSPLDNLPTRVSLKNHLLGLFSNISSLDGRCSGLVHVVLASEWVGRDEAYVKLFIRFLGTLAAARGGYLNSILKMLATGLRQVPKGTGKLPGYPSVRSSEIYARIHLAIKYILQLVPAGSGALSPVLLTSFPHETDTAKVHITYTRNLVKIIDYAPELRSDILALITDRLVKIDVQIQVDMEDLEDEIENDIVHSGSATGLIEPEGEDGISDSESMISDGTDDAESQRIKKLKGNIQKIDYIIDALFEYYAIPFTTGTVVDKENALDLLLTHFQNIILPTYRSRHSQFLLFHYSQSSPVLIDRFATACIQIIFSKSQPTIIRQYAAAYLASFVARGAHVSSEVVRDVFDLLGTHLENLRSEYEGSCRGPDLRRYGPFYSTSQALLYIFCFRWRDLTTAALEDDVLRDDLELDEVSFPPSIRDLLHQTIYSKLNPLKICSPSIVAEFARIAHHLHLIYVYPLLETNKRLRISSFRNLASMAMESRFGQVERETRADDDRGSQLDAYFPFDPYHLPRSRRWLEGDYVEWRGIPGLDDRPDEHDDTDSRAGEDLEMNNETETDEDD